MNEKQAFDWMRGNKRYGWVLDEHHNVALQLADTREQLIAWSDWHGDINNRRVAKDVIDGIRISTVFIGGLAFPDLYGLSELFETMVFDEREESKKYNPIMGERIPVELDDYTQRYGTWAEAEAGHEEVKAQVIEYLAA